MRPLHEAYARDSSSEQFRKANFDVTSQSPADIQSVANEEIVLPDDTLQTITAMLRSAELEAGSAQTMDTEVNSASLLARGDRGDIRTRDGRTGKLSDHTSTDHFRAWQQISTLPNVGQSDRKRNQHDAKGTEICLECRMESGRSNIRVADNEIGIAETGHAAVLKPFRRLDTSRSTRGNGLGLSLASSIASYHHGTLGLKNLPEGLEVTIRF